MKSLIRYIRQYFHEVDKRVLAGTTLFVAGVITLNYTTGLDDRISDGTYLKHLTGSYAVFLAAFLVPYIFYRIAGSVEQWKDISFVILLFIAPLIFALKHTFIFPFTISTDPGWQNYWEHIFYWPVLVILTATLLFIVWKIYRHPDNFYGLTVKNLDLKPYLLMLLMMIPLIAAASTQPDFIATYPKLKVIEGINEAPGMSALHKLIFEISYGSDFITIELFFRGFLVLAFVKWVGREAILPMACFYCTIHFGKPLGECISSYFGGILLGIVVYHTRSIFGGLIVHLGIAWLMEAGGYIGGLLQK